MFMLKSQHASVHLVCLRVTLVRRVPTWTFSASAWMSHLCRGSTRSPIDGPDQLVWTRCRYTARGLFAPTAPTRLTAASCPLTAAPPKTFLYANSLFPVNDQAAGTDIDELSLVLQAETVRAMTEETRIEGTVSRKIYLKYFTAGSNYLMLMFILLLSIIAEVRRRLSGLLIIDSPAFTAATKVHSLAKDLRMSVSRKMWTWKGRSMNRNVENNGPILYIHFHMKPFFKFDPFSICHISNLSLISYLTTK